MPEIDVILAGHAHATIPQATINGVLIVEPYRWGRGVSKVALTVDENGAVTAKTGKYLSGEEVAPDPDILALAEPYQETALGYVNSEIGAATGDFPGAYEARWQDGPLADFINAVQLQMAEEAGYPADLSLAAIFNNEGQFTQGPVTMADVYGIYQYDNTLYVIEVTGDILKRALEHDAEYWAQYDPNNPPADIEGLLAGDMRDYNWDMYSGIEYKLDISKPVGERVVELKYNGEDVTPDQTFVLAINNYRGGGGGGYDMFTDGEVLWKSMSEIRDYMAEYITAKEVLDPAEYYVQNWSLEPAGLYEQIGGPVALPESGSSASADVAHVLMLTGGGFLVLGLFLLRRRAVRTG